MDHSNDTSADFDTSPDGNIVREIPLREVDDSDALVHFRGEISSSSLIRSMEREGLKVPIRVSAEGGRYKVLDGFRRARAAKRLGWTTIQAIVYPPVPRAEARRIAFRLNVTCGELSDQEKAEAAQLGRHIGYTRTEVEEFLGLSSPELDGILARHRQARRTSQSTDDQSATESSS